MRLDTQRRHQIDEDGAHRLIVEVTRQAVRDAQRGDDEARQWLVVCAPDIAERLNRGWVARTRHAKAA